MPGITYVEKNGKKHEFELPEGISVMQGAVSNSVPGIDGDCGVNAPAEPATSTSTTRGSTNSTPSATPKQAC